MYYKTCLFLLILGVISCEKNDLNLKEESSKPIFVRDLNDIKLDRTLKVLVSYSSTSYFLYRGQTMGFEYELLERMAKELDLKLELIVVNNLDSIIPFLNSGKVDLVAHGLTITSDRAKKIAFTDYLYLTTQVLVQKKPDHWREMNWADIQRNLIHDAIDLIGDTVSVREKSSYDKRLINLSAEIGGDIHIDVLPGNLSTEEIIKKVAQGEIKYTVADKNLALAGQIHFPILDISVPMSLSQRIGWAVRKSSPKLLNEINQWLQKTKKEVDYYVIYNRYFKNKGNLRKRVQSKYMSLNGNQLSQYDELIKFHAKKIGWDWRLLAALIYQESQFNLKAKSWSGAKGLMQIMPRTAQSLGITDPLDPEQSINGGTNYLKQLFDDFPDIKDSTERLKFTMASYNCGYYHIKDARRLAELNQLDPNKWENNVEQMVLDLSFPEVYSQPHVEWGYVRGIEPVLYVEQIFKRYDEYVSMIE